MKKLFIYITLSIIIMGFCIGYSKNPNKELKSEQDFIKFAMEAEKRLLTVYFVGNPRILKENKIKPVRIISKKDIEKILLPYWDYKVIDTLWKQGSSHMPKLPFGFYGERDYGLLEASNIRIKSKNPSEVIITGRVSGLDEFYDRNIILTKTLEGWKAIGELEL